MSVAAAFAFALELPGMLRLGSVRVPVFGVLAAAGIVATMALSQSTARLASVDAGRLWDAALVLLAAAFVVSRLMLVAAAPRTFMTFPWAVLTLPSLTASGVAVAALVTCAWLRWKKMRLIDVLDAWSPCACVLAAVLAAAHFVEGTDAGMPTRLPWGVITPGDTVLGRVQPVEIYAAVAWLVLGAVSLRVLRHRGWAGEAVGWTLALGGVLSFLLDMLRQPVQSEGGAWLDPGQYVALAASAGGAWMLLRPWMDGPRHWPCGGVIERDEALSVAGPEEVQERD